jgi:hypothetical protein
VNGNGLIENQRANLVIAGSGLLANPTPTAGGLVLLNTAAFTEPGNPSAIGNTGRNAFRGPGLYSTDIALSRSFSVSRIHEGLVMTIRADAFNVLNHANLNNPDNLYGSPTFGVATYGRQGTASGFPAQAPLNETARQVQVLVRLEF